MAAPAYGTKGTYLATSTSTPSVVVPASVAADDIITITGFIGDTSGTVATVTGLAGFEHAEDSPVTISGVGGAHGLIKIWKRATGADSGTYNLTLSANVYVNLVAERYTGCITTGSPWDSGHADAVDSAIDTANNTVTPAVDITTQDDERLVVFSATNWAGGAWTPPTAFTERVDESDQLFTVATKEQATAGTISSITATCVGSDKRIAWVGALKPPGSGSQNIGMNLLTVASTLFNPAVVTGAVQVVTNLLSVPSTVFNPSVESVVQTSLLEVPSTIFNPSITVGSVVVETNLLSVPSTLFQPTVVNSGSVSTLLLSVPSTIFNPTVVRTLQQIEMLLLSVPSTIYNPDVTGGEAASVANKSLMDIARVNLLAELSLSEPQLLTNTDLMRLLLEDGGQVLVPETDATAAVHLWRYLKTIRDL